MTLLAVHWLRNSIVVATASLP